MSHQRGDARKRLTLVPTPCCDAAAKVERVRELADEWEKWSTFAAVNYGETGDGEHARLLRAALDGPAGGGAA